MFIFVFIKIIKFIRLHSVSEVFCLYREKAQPMSIGTKKNIFDGLKLTRVGPSFERERVTDTFRYENYHIHFFLTIM